MLIVVFCCLAHVWTGNAVGVCRPSASSSCGDFLLTATESFSFEFRIFCKHMLVSFKLQAGGLGEALERVGVCFIEQLG